MHPGHIFDRIGWCKPQRSNSIIIQNWYGIFHKLTKVSRNFRLIVTQLALYVVTSSRFLSIVYVSRPDRLIYGTGVCLSICCLHRVMIHCAHTAMRAVVGLGFAQVDTLLYLVLLLFYERNQSSTARPIIVTSSLFEGSILCFGLRCEF
jgi:hypothetical protein